jgi:hypothetical protein
VNVKGAVITKYDRELVEMSEVFLAAAKANPESCALLEKYGFSKEEFDRGIVLCREARRSFEWEEAGKAWNFLSPTPERRKAEAKLWYADTRRRYVRACLRRAEEAAGWVGQQPAAKWSLARKLTIGAAVAVLHAKDAASLRAWREHREELAANLRRAAGPKPEGAPPPKDTALVELAGWYERWRLLAQRVFRQRPDLMAPYGLKPGKAPPRLRGKDAAKYGEKAAGAVSGAPSGASAEDDDDGLGDPEEAPTKPSRANGAAKGSGQRLPIVS